MNGYAIMKCFGNIHKRGGGGSIYSSGARVHKLVLFLHKLLTL